MSNKHASKPSLSKGILEMKFMQRTKAKVDKEEEAAEGRAMYSKEISEKMLNSNSNFIIEPSFVHCENLIEGRLSFRGMNPEIERLLELEREEKQASKTIEQPTDVSQEELIKLYHTNKAPSAARNMEKKFKKNNKRHSETHSKFNGQNYNNKKTKFMKPRNSDEEDEETAP